MFARLRTNIENANINFIIKMILNTQANPTINAQESLKFFEKKNKTGERKG